MDEIEIPMVFYSNETANRSFVLRRVKPDAIVERGQPTEDQVLPIDISTATIILGVMDEDDVLRLTLASDDRGGLVIDDGPAGAWSVSLDQIPTNLQPSEKYRYDAVAEFSNGYRMRLFGGPFSVLQGIAP